MNDRLIPGGICSRRQHEALTGNDDGGAAKRSFSHFLYNDETGVGGKPVPPAPERETLLEEEMEEIIIATGSNGQRKAARRILCIPRIARGLKLLDDIDSGAVELICQSSLTRRESSDER